MARDDIGEPGRTLTFKDMPIEAPQTLRLARPVSLRKPTDGARTAALWQCRPAPEGPDPAPDSRSDTLTLAEGQIIAARVRGKRHKHEGTPCDDWYEVGHREGVLFAAVADGAGSRKFSRVGARESCEAAAGYIATAFERLFAERPELRRLPALSGQDPAFPEVYGPFAAVVQEAVVQAHRAARMAFLRRAHRPEYAEALGRGLQIEDLSATLLAAAAVPLEGGERLAVACQIGDGMMALLDGRGDGAPSLKLMGEADSGPFAGETEFLAPLSEAALKEKLRRKTRAAVTRAEALLVMTDGVADDYFPYEPELRRLYLDLRANGILEGPPLQGDRAGLPAGMPGQRLEAWLDNYVERGSFDDRTLAILWMGGAAP